MLLHTRLTKVSTVSVAWWAYLWTYVLMDTLCHQLHEWSDDARKAGLRDSPLYSYRRRRHQLRNEVGHMDRHVVIKFSYQMHTYTYTYLLLWFWLLSFAPIILKFQNDLNQSFRAAAMAIEDDYWTILAAVHHYQLFCFPLLIINRPNILCYNHLIYYFKKFNVTIQQVFHLLKRSDDMGEHGWFEIASSTDKLDRTSTLYIGAMHVMLNEQNYF